MLTTHFHTTHSQHDASEYGSTVAADGSHSGGPFVINVHPGMRIEELRRVIRVSGQQLRDGCRYA